MNVQLNFGTRVPQELDDPATHPGLDGGLGMMVRSVGKQAAQGVAGIPHDLFVRAHGELRQDGKGGADPIKLRKGCASAEAADGP
jgi:hypothetical protein